MTKPKEEYCNCRKIFVHDPFDSSKDGWKHSPSCLSLNPPKKRKSWNEYFLKIAQQVASRGTCNRKQVGAVVVRNKAILATGYNGSIRGDIHCDDVGHLMENGHCVRTIHAEQNAIICAAREGISIDGSEIFITCSPCWICFKMLANAGINKITFGEFYRDDKIFNAAEKLKIKLVDLSK